MAGASPALVGRCRSRVGDDRQHRGAGARLRRGRLAKKGPQALGRSRGGFSTKVHGVADSLGNPVRFALTAGQLGDAPQAIPLLEGIDAKAFLADRAYDSDTGAPERWRSGWDAILDWIANKNATAVIPPNPRRTNARQTDWSLYKERHKIEILFGMLKHYRRVFARFDKLAYRYLAFIHFAAACILLR